MEILRRDRDKIDEYKIDETLTEYKLDYEFGTMDIPDFIDFLPKDYRYSDFLLVYDDSRCSFDTASKLKNYILNCDIEEGVDRFCFIIHHNDDIVMVCYEYGYNVLTIKKDTKLDTFDEDAFAQYLDDIVGKYKKK